MMIPTIHLNGTSRERLVDQACDAARALRAAIAAMQDAWPNARDYYPQGDGAFRQAEAEYGARIAAVRAVCEQYVALAEAIADAGKELRP